MNIIKYFTEDVWTQKRETNTKLMAMKANGFPDKNAEKIDEMIEFYKINKIDVVMLSTK